VIAFQRGGSQPDDVLRADAILFVTLGVLALVAPWPLIRGRWALVAAASLAGLAVWTGVSIAWARIKIAAVDDTARLALYALAFAVALIAMRSPRVRRAAPWVLLGGIAAAAVYGLGTRLLPATFPAEIFGTAGARLTHPITYWNGLGLLTACGTLLGIANAAEPGAPRALRALACTLAVPCGLACYLTLSRGAFVAAFAGFVVLLLARPRRGTLLAAAAVLVPVGALIVAMRGFHGVREAPIKGAAEQASQGKTFAAIVVAAAVVAGVAFALLHRASLDRDESRVPVRRRTVLAVGIVAAILVGTVAISYASEQTEEIGTSAARLSQTKTFRGPYWDVALGAFADHPLTGVGSGSFRVEWRRHSRAPRGANDAHSLYFETLGELGIVGGLLLAAFVAALVAGIAAAARAAPRDPVLPAAAAVVAAFLVHAAVDWDWELPGVTLPALLLAAAALVRPDADIDSAA
jgi:hypothetical protein